jgi:hypothetical protein
MHLVAPHHDAAEQLRQSVGEQESITVLVLGGWSPGPLNLLKWRFRERCTFVEPEIPMPPVGVSWCVDPFCVLLVADLGLAPWLCSWLSSNARFSAAALILATGAVLIAAAVWARLCVAGLVRGAVRVGTQRAALLIRQRSVNIVMGFSWGGGVAAELLRQGRLGTSCTPAALLLAPTTAAIARFTLQDDPARVVHIDASDQGRVHVFHASDDGFCPDAQRECWEQTGATTHTCQDTHVFESASSLDEISRAFQSLCDLRARGGQSDETEI